MFTLIYNDVSLVRANVSSSDWTVSMQNSLCKMPIAITYCKMPKIKSPNQLLYHPLQRKINNFPYQFIRSQLTLTRLTGFCLLSPNITRQNLSFGRSASITSGSSVRGPWNEKRRNKKKRYAGRRNYVPPHYSGNSKNSRRDNSNNTCWKWTRKKYKMPSKPSREKEVYTNPLLPIHLSLTSLLSLPLYPWGYVERYPSCAPRCLLSSQGYKPWGWRPRCARRLYRGPW